MPYAGRKYIRDLIGAALLRYLAVAHFCPGEWEEGEHPGFWTDMVRNVVAEKSQRISELYAASKHGDYDTSRSMRS